MPDITTSHVIEEERTLWQGIARRRCWYWCCNRWHCCNWRGGNWRGGMATGHEGHQLSDSCGTPQTPLPLGACLWEERGQQLPQVKPSVQAHSTATAKQTKVKNPAPCGGHSQVTSHLTSATGAPSGARYGARSKAAIPPSPVPLRDPANSQPPDTAVPMGQRARAQGSGCGLQDLRRPCMQTAAFPRNLLQQGVRLLILNSVETSS